ncbi:unnamed protein product [Ostreobium quekettii]|uniref:Cysteine protease n=1 Tax=Ostreobium quekettii TaxID=121088 RepID=A0A8S1IXQ0_9CHLO|nr:unnamed protein product [Ostreobium quekettii]|eukprot:evm.model.scf_377EXC.5 EVM.evm.TU.scf_377EXC.5   scf_377EXC:63463-64719(-)
MRERVLFAVKHSLYSMAKALGLRKLQDYIQGATVLSGAPLVLLGETYQGDAASSELPSDVADAVLADFASRLWMSYRSGFPAIGDGDLTTDAGWGCTLRSGQMLVAQALVRHALGRQWRWEPGQSSPSELAEVAALFWDHPGEGHPLGLHGLCAKGGRHGVVAGRWLGPWALCNVLAEIVNSSRPLGLRVVLVSEPGGGAPFVNRERLGEYCALFEGAERQEGDKKASEPPGVGKGEGKGVKGDLGDETPGGGLQEGGRAGVVVLVALMLGVNKVNPAYLPQLKEVMTWPQSLGIVGGRPSASLYFVGHQEEEVIYLDPHEVQPVASNPGDASSYQCRVLRHMPIGAIDPSLAIGFYCRTPGEMEDLVDRIQGLEERAQGAPLVTVTSGEPGSARGGLGAVEVEADGDAEQGDWEVLS